MTDQHAARLPTTELDENELRLLDFERAWAGRIGNREAAVRAEFGVSTARYYQMLYALIDSPIAVRHDPLLVRRLQRLRESRRRARARPFTTDIPFTTEIQDVTE